MSVFLSYILLGLSLAAPVGPINAAQLDKGIKCGFLHAWLVGVGAVVADAIYMLVVYFGVVKFLEQEFIQTFLWLFGSFVLFYTGIDGLKNANVMIVKNQRGKEPLYKSFLSGFFMSLSNPLTILFWLGIYGSALAKTASTYGTEQLLVYSSAIFIGLLLWDIAMATFASTFRKYGNNKVLTMISILSSLSLIGFGTYFGYQAILVLMN